MSDHVKTDYNQITPEIFLGTNFCCQVHFEEELLQQGVRVDISLEAERIDSPEGVDAYLWLPTIDHEAPTQRMLKLGVRFMEDAIALGDKVYVHCKNGHGRSPTLVAAYFVYKGTGLEEAVEMIKKKRPEIHIEEPQMKALQDFETFCQAS